MLAFPLSAAQALNRVAVGAANRAKLVMDCGEVVVDQRREFYGRRDLVY